MNIESHGVVGNSFYDPVNDRRVNLIGDAKAITNDAKWWGGEPIWKTARNQVFFKIVNLSHPKLNHD